MRLGRPRPDPHQPPARGARQDQTVPPGRAAGFHLPMLLGIVTALSLPLAACEDVSYRDIGAQIGVLTKRTDPLVPRAQKRLAEHGRKALVQIETALHTATLAGRLNLIGALEAIGDAEAIPILRHLAVYDPKNEARRAAEAVLTLWLDKGGSRGDASRAALARVASLRSDGEKPLPPVE